VVAIVRQGSSPLPTARGSIADHAALDWDKASGGGKAVIMPTVEPPRDAAPAAPVEGAPVPRSSERPADDGVGAVDFNCPVCDRHYVQDRGSCPRDGAPLHAERISMPFLWWG
jgi:hypothetical protein